MKICTISIPVPYLYQIYTYRMSILDMKSHLLLTLILSLLLLNFPPPPAPAHAPAPAPAPPSSFHVIAVPVGCLSLIFFSHRDLSLLNTFSTLTSTHNQHHLLLLLHLRLQVLKTCNCYSLLVCSTCHESGYFRRKHEKPIVEQL